MNKSLKRLMIGLMVLLLGLLAACEGQPDNTAVTPTQPPLVSPEATVTAETASLPPNTGAPTFMAISQFPVAVIESASAQRPAYAAVEMAGFNISRLSWQVGQYDPGCNRLVSMGLILPNRAEERTGLWPDGVHRANFGWSAIGHYLGDGAQGDLVLVEKTATASFISGRFRSAASGEVVGANLLVDPAASQIVGLETLSGEPLTAVAGDGFQLFSQCLEPEGTVRAVPGLELVFLDEGQLNLEQQPTPSGDYFLHLTVNGPQNSVSSTTDFPVDNDDLVPEYQVYLDKTYGFQFLYPVGWQTPQFQNDRIDTNDGDSTRLTITIHPDLAGRSPADLKSQALAQFGNVPVLFENQVTVGDSGALWTAYGYSGPEGPRTGILLSFIRDSVGYLVDLDGLQTAEEQSISLMNNLAQNWLFRPDITAPRAMEWTAVSFDPFSMPVKANYYQETLDNGWRRFTVGDGVSFMALRTEALGRDDLSDKLDHWQEVVQRGVSGMTLSEEYDFTLNQRQWKRIDFAYIGADDAPIQGFLMTAEINDEAVTFWIETPAARYDEQLPIFLLSIAGLQ